MRAADRPEHFDQDVEPADGRERIREQRDRRVAERQAFGHHAGTDHDRQQQRRAERFGKQLTRQAGCHVSSST